MKREDLITVATSFITFDTWFQLLESGDTSFLKRECGTQRYPQVEWMMAYFLEKEEYEKCETLSKLELPKPSRTKLRSEIQWLKLKGLG